MKPVLIVENCNSGLKLNEGVSSIKDDRIFLNGIFTEFDVMNRNERIYTKDKFIPHMNDLLERKKQLGAIYGEFDHPDVFDTSLSRVSHTLESLTYNSDKNRIEGEIRLLNTYWGKEAKALVLDGCPIFVSSRAAGVTESDNTVTIKKLFTYDAVADPGFSSAKMSIKVINESLGFKQENTNFRIYDVSDEVKINELFNMNNNDMVTKQQMVEYSEYLTKEISKIKEELNESVKSNVDPTKIDSLADYYEKLQENFSKVSKYLDYLADNIQIVVNENKSLKETTEKLIQHNDYLAEKLTESINYSEYIAEKLDKNIDYSEYIAETLDKNIDFSEYIAEHVDKNIKYSEYIAEKIDQNIDYAEYLAEHLDNNIAYSEYLAEHVDNNINYSEYLAEHLDNNIAYSEYLAEHVDNNINYSEYIAENVADSQAYGKYIAESLDKTIDYLKASKLFEKIEADDQKIPQLQADDVQKYYDDEDEEFDEDDEDKDDEEDNLDDSQAQAQAPAQKPIEDQTQAQPAQPAQAQAQTAQTDAQAAEGQAQTAQTDAQTAEGEAQTAQTDAQAATTSTDAQAATAATEAPVQAQTSGTEAPVETETEVTSELVPDMIVKIDNDKTGEILSYNPTNKIAVVKLTDSTEVEEVHESRLTILGDKLYTSENELKNNIKNLIAESKKRKVSEEQIPHFLYFLSEANKNIFVSLSFEDKEKVKSALNESTYTTETEVLTLIREALSIKKKTNDEILISNIPQHLSKIWEGLNSTVKESILNQSKLYPGLTTSASKMDSFWNSRDLESYTMINESKKLLNESKTFVDNSKLTESQLESYLKVFKKL
jgi:hypothetical protein